MSPAIADSWPLYFRDEILVGNPEAGVGIITLWTKRERIAKYLDTSSFAAVGQLYSRDEGLSALLRNFLANKNIRHIVMVGADLNKSGEALTQLFSEGVDAENRVFVPSVMAHAKIDKEIPRWAIEEFRRSVQLHDYRNLGIDDWPRLRDIVLELPLLGPYGNAEVFPRAEIKPPERFPTDYSGFKVRERTVGDAWLKTLNLILRFGAIKKSQYGHGQDQKELLNLMNVVTGEDPNKPEWRSFYAFTRMQLDEYFPQILSANKFEGVHYTYGQRLREHFKVDQIQAMIDLLKRAPSSRRAVACTWDAPIDTQTSEPPCLDLIQALVQDDMLFLTAYLRSNDMFNAWPLNAYGLRKLQFMIAEEVGLKPGSLTIISNSAHIYQPDWKRAEDILAKYPISLEKIGDPRGNLVIRVEEGKIIVTHLDDKGNRIGNYEGTTAADICKKLALESAISDPFHIFDVGAELQKAEIALKLGLRYSQDQPLEFKNFSV